MPKRRVCEYCGTKNQTQHNTIEYRDSREKVLCMFCVQYLNWLDWYKEQLGKKGGRRGSIRKTGDSAGGQISE